MKIINQEKFTRNSLYRVDIIKKGKLCLPFLWSHLFDLAIQLIFDIVLLKQYLKLVSLTQIIGPLHFNLHLSNLIYS